MKNIFLRLERLRKQPLYSVPEPFPRTRSFWIATGLVTAAVVLFCVYFSALVLARQDALWTNAEDLGIMDQAVWNTVHGHVLHQTICNIITDTNCVSQAGIMRFAIHVEPILLPLSLIYLFPFDVRALLVIQTVVVALGAYPAFWLARLRLRNNWLAIGLAFLYLLYPVVHQGVTFDFHAVTFTSTLLLFVLYFMYTRRTVWLFVFAVLAAACKEEIPLVLAVYGAWSVLFQWRWRSGTALALLGCAWFLLNYKVLIPHFSPTHAPLLIGRYAQVLGHDSVLLHPRTFIRQYILDDPHQAYLHVLFGPAGTITLPQGTHVFYLLWLAPWILVMALPTLAINTLSSDPFMYSGMFQYNAEIVPVLIFAAIEALITLSWLFRLLIAGVERLMALSAEKSIASLERPVPQPLARNLSSQRALHISIIAITLCGVLVSALDIADRFNSQLPFSKGFVWPTVTAHAIRAQRFFDLIPASASVSAQTKLVPHLSHREEIYMFPYADQQVDYILLDTTSDIYPYADANHYISEVRNVLLSGKYGVLAAEDGYILLKHGMAPPAKTKSLAGVGSIAGDKAWPNGFCTDQYVTSDQLNNPLQVDFQSDNGGAISLVGFDAQPSASPVDRAHGTIDVTTYWRISSTAVTPFQILFLLVDTDGDEHLVHMDAPSLSWCPATSWRSGSILQLKGKIFDLTDRQVPKGLAQTSIALLPLTRTSSTIMDVQARLPLSVVHAPQTVSASTDTNTLQLMPLTIVE